MIGPFVKLVSLLPSNWSKLVPYFYYVRNCTIPYLRVQIMFFLKIKKIFLFDSFTNPASKLQNRRIMLRPLLRRYPLLLLFSSLGISTVCLGDDFDDAIIADKVSELGIRGAAIAVFNKNTMEAPITRGYGQVSSAESSSSVTPDTAFMIASISKPFVASAVAVLVDKGIISIDDDICVVVPDNFSKEMCRNPMYPNQAVTWRMLITHRSSMKRELPMVQNQSGDWISPSSGPSGSFYADFEDTGNPTCPLDGVVAFYRALLTDDPDARTTVGSGVKLQNGEDLNWYELAMSEGGIWDDYIPGERVEYSNVAYGYLVALIELATDQSFPDFCRDNLFDPLGMKTTAWFLEDLPSGTLTAVPVETGNNGGFIDIGQYCFIDYGSGSLRTTANDLARWGTAMLEYGSPTLWSSNVGSEVVKCQERDETNESVLMEWCEFGYGWILLNDNSMRRRRRRDLEDRNDDATLAPTAGFSAADFSIPSTPASETAGEIKYDLTDGIMHDGSEAGVQTNIIILPKAGIYVAVLLNTNDDDSAAEELTAAVIDAVSSDGGILNDLLVLTESSSSSSQSSRSEILITAALPPVLLLLLLLFDTTIFLVIG